MQDGTTRKQYESVYNGSFLNGEGLPHMAKGFYMQGEFAFKEYTSVNLELATRPNIVPVEHTVYSSYYETFHKLSCININPSVRWYKKSMSPAPLGNYFSFGINYNICRLDSFESAFTQIDPSNPFNPTTISLYNSKGKFNFWDISFGTGRNFIIKNVCIVNFEFSIPYMIRFFPSMVYGIDGTGFYASYYDITEEGVFARLLKTKIAANHMFNYKLGIGIPF